MSLQDRIRAQRELQAKAQDPQAAQGDVWGAQRKAQAQIAAGEPLAPSAPPPAAPAAPLLSIRDKIRGYGVNRPEEPATIVPESDGPVTPRTPEPLVDVPTSPSVPEPVEAPAPAKRAGRPRRVVTAEAAATVVADLAAAADALAAPAKFTLCVDCVPHVPYVTIAELCAPLAREIEATNKVRHYRLIDFKAGGLLAAALRERLAKDPVTGVIVTTRATFEGRETLSVLEEFAGARFYGVSS